VCRQKMGKFAAHPFSLNFKSALLTSKNINAFSCFFPGAHNIGRDKEAGAKERRNNKSELSF
jgi:hypothetical protein